MKFKYRTKAEKWDAKVEKQCRWHKWFAWYPVRLQKTADSTEMVWLEVIGRKKKLCDYRGHYGNKEYVGEVEYCYELDLIPNTLTNGELCDERQSTKTKVAAKKLLTTMGTMKPLAPPPPPIPAKRIIKNGS